MQIKGCVWSEARGPAPSLQEMWCPYLAVLAAGLCVARAHVVITASEILVLSESGGLLTSLKLDDKNAPIRHQRLRRQRQLLLLLLLLMLLLLLLLLLLLNYCCNYHYITISTTNTKTTTTTTTTTTATTATTATANLLLRSCCSLLFPLLLLPLHSVFHPASG